MLVTLCHWFYQGMGCISSLIFSCFVSFFQYFYYCYYYLWVQLKWTISLIVFR